MKYEGDPYQVEYALIQDVEVLREGTWNWTGYDREFIEEIALIYDPAMLRAKVAKDHEYYGPAFGHVLALRLEDDLSADGSLRLMATVGFLDSGKAMIESGEYNERSIGWASFHPTPGIPYLWEFSLLGVNTPAAVGMEPIIFKPEEAEQMTRQLEVDRMNDGQTLGAIANQLVWEKTEDYIRHQVRQPSRFLEKTLRTIELDVDAGIMAVVGKLKPEYVPDGGKAASMVMQNVMFSLKMDWTLAKAKAWIGERNLAAIDVALSGVVPLQDLPMADAETEWDIEASETRRQEIASVDGGIDWVMYRLLHLWYDPDEKEKHESYKMPIVDIVDGELKVVPKAVIAAAESLADIPEADVEAVKQNLEKYYAKMEQSAPWQDKPEDSPTGVESIKDLVNLSQQGGNEMPETETVATETGTVIVREVGSTEDLSKKTIEMRELTERREMEAQETLRKEYAELAEKAEAARNESIRSEVRTMQAEGYIIGAQVDMGLAEALALLPDEPLILVGTDRRSALSIVKNALKYGGKLKLKLEIARDILNEDLSDPFAKARSHGIDTSVDERRIQLQKDDPKMSHAAALDRATREVKK